ncbi:MAG: formate dehydrogenase accessory protein FdhE [Deltaproteobacteria bacterium]|nr:formate dehydrogenase accessory protein FdhE [Deltaproteobacteria bacterium]
MKSTKKSHCSGNANTAIEKENSYADIIRAFSPVLSLKEAIIDSITAVEADGKVKFDEKIFGDGIPLLAQGNPLINNGEDVNDLSLKITSAIAEGFPIFAGEMENISQAIIKTTLRPQEYLAKYPKHDETAFATLASALSVSYEAIYLFFYFLTRIFLERKSRVLGSVIHDCEWDKGYCAICGGAPMLAKIKQEKHGQRWLVCSVCLHQWRFNRVVCPHCYSEGKEETNYIFINEEEHDSAFYCDKCKRYLVTLYRIAEFADSVPSDIHSIKLSYIDVIMQNKGYLPMATLPWNKFGAS